MKFDLVKVVNKSTNLLGLSHRPRCQSGTPLGTSNRILQPVAQWLLGVVLGKIGCKGSAGHLKIIAVTYSHFVCKHSLTKHRAAVKLEKGKWKPEMKKVHLKSKRCT